MNSTRMVRAGAMLLLLFVALSGTALGATRQEEATQAQLLIDQAALALRAAEQVGAPMLAPELYNEANARIRSARENANADKSSHRSAARIAAVEAKHAAAAAEARARWIAANREVVALRTDIVAFGAAAQAVALVDPQPLALARGSNSRDRVAYARRVVEAARVAGAHLVVPDDIRTAEQNLDTASKIVKNEKNSISADHLAYFAEMLARRGEYLARRAEVDRWLPGMRQERARLAQASTEAQAAREQQSRVEAQRQATELRQRLQAEATNRQLQEGELARLREQVSANEQRLQAQVNEDRGARIAAETRLDELRREYERALAAPGSLDEVEAMRRRLEDQQRSLQALEAREALSQQTASAEVAELRRQLQQERQFGNADVAQREEELRLRTDELERMRVEREEALARRADSERVFETRIADLERARQEAVAQTAQLQEQVDQERARADAAQAELEKARSVAAEATRVAEFQSQLAAIAQTRAEDRGIIVTLPGIYFDTGKSTLKSGAKNILARIASQLKTNPSASVIIEGHTDSVGSDATNRQLSTARAEAVRAYLVSEGVPSTRFTVVGHGESAPIATNDTAAGRQQNRRVELVFTTPEMTAGR